MVASEMTRPSICAGFILLKYAGVFLPTTTTTQAVPQE